MTDVVLPAVSVDAVDLVDAPGVENGNSKDDDDADFDAFNNSARALQGETVAEAVAEAVAAVDAAEIDPKLVVTNPQFVEDHRQRAPITPEKTANDDNVDPENSRYVAPKDFELLKVIGMGAFGKVLQVKNKQSSQILAMKVISKRLLKRKSGYIENVQAERNILKRVNHPFVVKMHCSFQTKEKLFIIMDFLAGGEMFLKLGKEGIFLEKDAAFYLAEMILGVDHLHQLGILHRDLKPYVQDGSNGVVLLACMPCSRFLLFVSPLF